MKLTLGPVASYDQNSHVSPYFHHLDLINVFGTIYDASNVMGH